MRAGRFARHVDRSLVVAPSAPIMWAYAVPAPKLRLGDRRNATCVVVFLSTLSSVDWHICIAIHLPRRLQRASRRIELCGGATTYVLELGKALLTPSDPPSHRHIGESPASACRPFLKVETCGILQELLIIPAHGGESSRFRAIACVRRSSAVGFYNAYGCVLSSSMHH